MKKYFLKKNYLLLLAFAVLFSSDVTAQKEENIGSVEPGNNFEITINDKKFKLKENEVLTLDTIFSKSKVSIKLADTKLFDDSLISFEYPRYLSFEFVQDSGYKNWKFSGTNLVIMLFELDTKTTLNDFVEEMIPKFGKRKSDIKSFQGVLGIKQCKCKRLTVSLFGTKLSLDFYEILLNDSKSRFIVFQNTLKNEENYNEECRKGFGVINTTIIYK